MEGLENVQLFDMVNASEMKQAESIQPEIRKISESAFEEFRKTYPLKKHDNAFFLPQEKELLQTIQKKETRNYIYFFSPISFRQVELFNSIAHTRILGFLRFAFNKTELYHPIRATLEKLIQGASYVLIAGIIGILIFSLFITHPITKLQHGVENIRNGNLDFQIHIHSADELGYLGRQFNEMVLTLKEKLEIQKFVSVGTTEAITRKIRDKSDLVPHRENLTLLFSDIRGFTSLSEKLTPENVILLLNNYFENLSHIIMEAGGDIDKYVGDEIFAIFRGANKETNAVRAAIQMQKAVEKINKTRFPVEEPIAIGIGISTGWAVLGSMGSSVRMDYTAIGDTVNTGARLCDIASEDEILISPSTYDKVKEEYSAEYRGAIELKGKTAPLPVYSVSYR
jgi:adenylate cyclase